jgi:hypothetical protein
MTGGEPKMGGNYLGTVTDPMSQLGQNRKGSMRANVFRSSPNNGHSAARSTSSGVARAGRSGALIQASRVKALPSDIVPAIEESIRGYFASQLPIPKTPRKSTVETPRFH